MKTNTDTKSDRSYTEANESNTNAAGSGRGRMAILLSAALVALAVLASFIISSSATGAAPVDPGDQINELPPGDVDNLPPLVPQMLTASLQLDCINVYEAAVTVTVTNNSPSQQSSFAVITDGPSAGVTKSHGIAPGSTSTVDYLAGRNGDVLHARVENASGTILVSRQYTVDCGTPDPSAHSELDCTHPDGPQITVHLENGGSAAFTADVFASPQGQTAPAGESAVVTVNPGEAHDQVLPVHDAYTYDVWVDVQGSSVHPFVKWIIPVDCDDPKPPEPPQTPTNPTVGAPKFTG